jgi:hypothetical protein
MLVNLLPLLVVSFLLVAVFRLLRDARKPSLRPYTFASFEENKTQTQTSQLFRMPSSCNLKSIVVTAINDRKDVPIVGEDTELKNMPGIDLTQTPGFVPKPRIPTMFFDILRCSKDGDRMSVLQNPIVLYSDPPSFTPQVFKEICFGKEGTCFMLKRTYLTDQPFGNLIEIKCKETKLTRTATPFKRFAI